VQAFCFAPADNTCDSALSGSVTFVDGRIVRPDLRVPASEEAGLAKGKKRSRVVGMVVLGS
jgi:hypothetical protein